MLRRNTIFVPFLICSGLAAQLAEPGVPVHQSLDGETWAATPGYKVSFHDGVAFYPRLGTSRDEHLPVTWRTARVRVGDVDLEVTGDPKPRTVSDSRVEYRHPRFTEVYDVLEEGLEQSFVFASRPGTGDLIIEGSVATPLAARAVSDRHGSLDFRDASGASILDYGAAFALDQAGRRAEITTSWDGATARLTVPESWLRDAVYPVIVDPLLSPVVIDTAIASWGAAGRPEVVNVSTGVTNTSLVFFSRPWTGTDWDCFAYRYDGNLANPVLVYSDISVANSSRNVAASFVGATQRWVMAHDQQNVGPPLTGSSIRVATAPLDPLAGAVASQDLYAIEPGHMLVRPDVGGTIENSTVGTRALVVCQENFASGTQTSANGYLIDTATTTYVAGFNLDDLPFFFDSRGHPAVNQFSLGGTNSWMTVWQSQDQPTSAWTIRGALVGPDATVRSGADFGLNTIQSAVRPRVAGDRGNFLLTYVLSNSLQSDYGDKIYTERITWRDNMASPAKLYRRLIANASGNNNYRNSDVAHDRWHQTMYAMTWEGTIATGLPRVEVARIGSTGAVTEWRSLDNSGEPAITYEADAKDFVVAHGSLLAGYPVQAQRFIYDPAALNVAIGTTCGGRIFSPFIPAAGFSGYDIRLDQAPPNVASWLFLAGSSVNLPLDPIGMAGCNFYVGGTVISLPAVTDTTGLARIGIPLPDSPLVTGDLYAQWFHDGAATQLGLASTQGMRVQIR